MTVEYFYWIKGVVNDLAIEKWLQEQVWFLYSTNNDLKTSPSRYQGNFLFDSENVWLFLIDNFKNYKKTSKILKIDRNFQVILSLHNKLRWRDGDGDVVKSYKYCLFSVTYSIISRCGDFLNEQVSGTFYETQFLLATIYLQQLY